MPLYFTIAIFIFAHEYGNIEWTTWDGLELLREWAIAQSEEGLFWIIDNKFINSSEKYILRKFVVGR